MIYGAGCKTLHIYSCFLLLTTYKLRMHDNVDTDAVLTCTSSAADGWLPILFL